MNNDGFWFMLGILGGFAMAMLLVAVTGHW
jgi:short subunit fatty acids transporter